MEDYQNKLFPYAYNILGSSDDAKDAVQEILAKFHEVPKTTVQNEMGYLIRSVVNESINLKKKRQRALLGQMWLPEPVTTEQTDDSIDSSVIISYSLMVLLEKLSTKERAVFILKEAFDYSHKEIGVVLDFSIENSRKLLSRARTKLEAYKKHNELGGSSAVSNEYMQLYVDSIRNGDVKILEKMLSEEVVLAADGGGEIKVVRELTRGLKAAVKLLLYVFQTFQVQNTIKVGQVNHQPALLYYQDGVLVNCQIFQISNDKIVRIYAQLAPKKLKVLGKAYNP
nr:sigma factor-like helix-turn-helix DNA-binding protein [Allomuricauda sp.]